MNKFRDKKDREWVLDLDVSIVESLEKQVGFKLAEAMSATQGLSEVLFAKAATLVRILWVCCEEQAAALSITPEEFGRGFNGPAIAGAVDAMVGAIIDFFHRPEVATAMKAKMPTLLREMETKMIQVFEAKSSLLMSSPNAGDSPESLQSIPGG